MQADAPPENVVAHGHSNPHAVFTFAGTYFTAANKESVPLATAALVINPPDMWHRDRYARGNGSFLAIDLPRGVPGTAEPRVVRDAATVTACLRLIRHLPDAETLLLQEASREIVCGRGISAHKAGSRITRAYAAIMDSDTPEQLDLQTLARLAECHPNHVSSAFKERFGMPAARLLRRRRIERACGLLRDMDRALADIALQLGFTDQAHFSRVFSTEMGVPPGRWRKNIAGL